MGRRTRRGWRKAEVDPARVAPLLREAGFIACDGDPIQVTAWYDRESRPRRVDAKYPGGIRATFHIGITGGGSLTQSIQIKVSTR